MDEKWHSQRSLKFFGEASSEGHAFLDRYFRQFGPSHRQLLHHGPDNCSLGAAIPSSGRIGGGMLKTKYQNQYAVPYRFIDIEIGHPFVFCGAVMMRTSKTLAFNLDASRSERLEPDTKCYPVQHVQITASEPK